MLRHLSLVHIARMAHIRRKIFEAREDAPVACARLLALIQQLYRVERRAKEEKLDRGGLLRARREESRPVMENLGELLRLFAKLRPPRTPFGKAMSYAEGQWPAMMRYLGRHPQEDILDLTPRGWRDARARAAGAAVPPD